MAQPAAWCSRADIAESTEPAPACCLDTGMVAERSWNEINAGVRKNLRVAQPLEIVAEKETIHRFYDDKRSVCSGDVSGTISMTLIIW